MELFFILVGIIIVLMNIAYYLDYPPSSNGKTGSIFQDKQFFDRTARRLGRNIGRRRF